MPPEPSSYAAPGAFQAFFPAEASWLEAPPDRRLEHLLLAVFGLADASAIPRKLGLSAAAWADLSGFLAEGAPLQADPAPSLRRLAAALRAVGASERYTVALRGVCFPSSLCGGPWPRALGPASPEHRAFGRALARLRWEETGVRLLSRLRVAENPVDFALVGLLPDGSPLRLAVLVRPQPRWGAALWEDLAEDAIAEAGFEVLGLRDWQLRDPEGCAAHVARAVRARAPHWAVSEALLSPWEPAAGEPAEGPEDGPEAGSRWGTRREEAVAAAALSAPSRLTPRSASPRWAVRCALRRAHPGLGEAAFLTLYREHVAECERASTEADCAEG